MARPRKPLSQQKGNLLHNDIERKRQEEEAASTGRGELESPPQGIFDDAAARKEYFRVLANLKDFPIIGNLDMANLVVYANAFSRYKRAHKGIRDWGDVIDGKENPYIQISERAYKEMASAGGKCGIDISSRLKAGEDKIKRQEQELEDLFGDI